jgi:hypothetical protein
MNRRMTTESLQVIHALWIESAKVRKKLVQQLVCDVNKDFVMGG